MKQKKGHYSDGEDLIEIYLDEIGMLYKTEVKIHNLKGDYASYRVADFYLPGYGIYVEFLGRWNVSEFDKSKYRTKRKMYKKNNIPCAYLYPDNLGILDFIFIRRVKEVLKQHKKRFALFRFNSKFFFQENIMGLAIVGALVYFSTDIRGKLVFGTILLYLLYKGIKKFYFN